MKLWDKEELMTGDEANSEQSDWTYSKDNPENDRTLMSRKDLDALLDAFYDPHPFPGGSEDVALAGNLGTVAIEKKHLLGLAHVPDFQLALESDYFASIEDRGKSGIRTSTPGFAAPAKEGKTDADDEVVLVEDPSWAAMSGLVDGAEESKTPENNDDDMPDNNTSRKGLEGAMEDGQTLSAKRTRPSSSMITSKAPFRPTAQDASGLPTKGTASRRLSEQPAAQLTESFISARSTNGQSLMDSQHKLAQGEHQASSKGRGNTPGESSIQSSISTKRRASGNKLEVQIPYLSPSHRLTSHLSKETLRSLSRTPPAMPDSPSESGARAKTQTNLQAPSSIQLKAAKKANRDLFTAVKTRSERVDSQRSSKSISETSGSSWSCSPTHSDTPARDEQAPKIQDDDKDGMEEEKGGEEEEEDPKLAKLNALIAKYNKAKRNADSDERADSGSIPK